MEKVSVSLKNCYGIKELEHIFNFANHRAQLIYAPNGAMKSSFARVFADRQEGLSPSDRIFPNRVSECHISDDQGTDITGEDILVVEPYQQDFYASRLSTLLVNKRLKERYEAIHASIESKTEQLVKQLNEIVGRRIDIVDEFCRSFEIDSKDFLTQLENLEKEVNDDTNSDFQDIEYTEVFNSKVYDFLQKPVIRRGIAEYVEKLNELLEASTYFKRGIFNHNNATNISKSLKENGFFAAQHSVLLNRDTDRKEILTQADMDSIIEQEKNTILNDQELSNRFEKIDKEITKNADLR